MSGSYNLRSIQRKKSIPVGNCYLQNFPENFSPEAFNPKVCLQRLKLLECHNVQNNRFYSNKGRISIKKNKHDLMIRRKYLLKLFCIIILIGASGIYWKDYFQSNGITAIKKFSEIFPEFCSLYFVATKFHLYDSKQSSHQKNKTSTENRKPLVSEEKLIVIQENLSIGKLIRDFPLDIKNSDKEESTINPPSSFIIEQCNANITQNINSVKKNFYNSTFFELSNLTDYALDSQGAKIVTVFNTELYGTLAVKFLNLNLWPEFTNFLMKYFKCFSSSGPNSILIPWKKPGDCWAFKGSQGRVQIQLSEEIFIRAISIDHIPKEIAHNEGIQSAPKQFTIAGIKESETHIDRVPFGTYEYKNSEPATQTFFIKPEINVSFRKIELVIKSNHGNKLYTCVYKIRVHGHK